MTRPALAAMVVVATAAGGVIWGVGRSDPEVPELPEVTAADDFHASTVPSGRNEPAEPAAIDRAHVEPGTDPSVEPTPIAEPGSEGTVAAARGSDSESPPGSATALTDRTAPTPSAGTTVGTGPRPPTPAPGAQAPAFEPFVRRDEPPMDPQTQIERIQDAMSGAMPRLRSCYNVLLREFPDASDRLVLSLEVALDERTGRGVPSIAGIDSELLTADDLDCFADVLVGLRFPPPVPDEDGQIGPYTITYPLVLTAE